jgi:hypothetical protein
MANCEIKKHHYFCNCNRIDVNKTVFLIGISLLFFLLSSAQNNKRMTISALKAELKATNHQLDSLDTELEKQLLRNKELEIQVLSLKAKYDSERIKNIINNKDIDDLQFEVKLMDSLLLFYEQRYHHHLDSINQIKHNCEAFLSNSLQTILLENLVFNQTFYLKYAQDVIYTGDSNYFNQILVNNENKLLKSLTKSGVLPDFIKNDNIELKQKFESHIEFKPKSFTLNLNEDFYEVSVEQPKTFLNSLFATDLSIAQDQYKSASIDLGEMAVVYNNVEHKMRVHYSIGNIDALTDDIIFQNGIVLWNDQCVLIFVAD